MAGVALAVLLVWLLVLRDDPAPVSVAEAVGEFREDEAGGEPVPEGVAVPETGVYVYATTGFEETDALLGSRHDYPAETTVTVTEGGCGLLLRWEALEGRATTWDVCPSADGWSIARYDEVHRFFGRNEETSYRCDAESAWRPSGLDPGTAFVRRCTSRDSDEDSRGEVVGTETVLVAGEEIDAAHLRLDVVLDGRTRGSGTFDTWLALEDGLLLRMEVTNENTSESPIGDVAYGERFELELTSPDPVR